MKNPNRWLISVLFLWVIFWGIASICKYISNTPEVKNSLGESFGILGLLFSLLIGIIPAILIYFVARKIIKKKSQ